ncbi:MAG: hypothetical protein ACD_29C00336G0001 [uncultured bacterium]|nr:MAG: hypothetical protein ACD_29C00336G0001 [uncultured bacterium]OGT34290.1 MAG: hypothetical protein A3C44_07450 [Gammaproteobacteria bacterium RIFCSPHIGHO2_02_FULL_39_13]OGT48939.1 MAG: hypothetical protein A3E53_01430 [Gammaproteobacteria bacterium RIFCSPHIGHO2_12_FULL_39_24]
MAMRANNAIIIGAGPMGLMAAYELQKKGFHVSVYERDDRIGGMSASFDFDGTQIERFYHFICKTDKPLFDLLSEFNLQHALRWTDTTMGFFYDGKLYPWGTPIGLLTFPKLNFLTKLRYGLMAFKMSHTKNWNKLDKITATAWLKKWVGKKGYEILWDSLFYYKFYHYKNDLSAAWLGTRIKRVGLSRRNLFKEQLGYLEGGSEILLDAMKNRIIEMGGHIYLNAGVDEVVAENNKVIGVNINGQLVESDIVVSTIPLPFVSKLVPSFSKKTHDQINAITNVAVACVLFKTKKSITQHFWVNINDSRIALPGIIEYTNLNSSITQADERIIYVPYYMPSTHEKYRWKDERFIKEATRYLSMISNTFTKEAIIAAKVTRYAYSQTVCSINFLDKLPRMRCDEIKGFYMADTAYYYPEDRSMSESVKMGSTLATLVHEDYQSVLR